MRRRHTFPKLMERIRNQPHSKQTSRKHNCSICLPSCLSGSNGRQLGCRFLPSAGCVTLVWVLSPRVWFVCFKLESSAHVKLLTQNFWYFPTLKTFNQQGNHVQQNLTLNLELCQRQSLVFAFVSNPYLCVNNNFFFRTVKPSSYLRPPARLTNRNAVILSRRQHGLWGTEMLSR